MTLFHDRFMRPKITGGAGLIGASAMSRLRFDKGRKSAIRGSRADEGVCPTLTLPCTVKNYPGQETSAMTAWFGLFKAPLPDGRGSDQRCKGYAGKDLTI
jgi:hypothetical protein